MKTLTLHKYRKNNDKIKIVHETKIEPENYHVHIIKFTIHKNCSKKLQCLHNNSTEKIGAIFILISNLSQKMHNVYNINEKYVYLYLLCHRRCTLFTIGKSAKLQCQKINEQRKAAHTCIVNPGELPA